MTLSSYPKHGTCVCSFIFRCILYTFFVDQKPKDDDTKSLAPSEDGSSLEEDAVVRQERKRWETVVRGPREQRYFSPRKTFIKNAE